MADAFILDAAIKERARNNFHKVAVPVGAWILEQYPSNSHRLGRW